jgi:hypothetical protein
VITCKEYVQLKTKSNIQGLIVANRVDIDQSVKKAKRIAEMFNDLGIKATFFVRLHANDYNPFSFENYKCLKFIRDSGHEIGYHSEVIDESVIWNEDAKLCLRRDIAILNRMLKVKISGVASHGGMTGLNNLDFWKDSNPKEFGLLYEAYDELDDFNLFKESLYISDSNWTRWKCYRNGREISGDDRWPSQHVKEGPPLIYLLIHPETYYDEHFYE